MEPLEPNKPSRSRIPRLLRLVVPAIVLALVAAVAVPLVATAGDEFFSRYHFLERRYVNLEDSAHEGIGCRACHETAAIANGAQLVAEYYTSILATNTTPRYFEFKPPTNDACLKCHSGDWSTETNRTDKIPHPAHLRVASETRQCVGCHKWTAHIEPYIEKHKTMPFSGVCVAYGCHVGTKATDQCFDCHHVLRQSKTPWLQEHRAVAKAKGQNACLESCHKVAECQECHTTGKKPKFDGLPTETGQKAIEVLHVRSDWTPKYHGPEALKDRSACTSCHQTTGECTECHAQRPKMHGSVATWIGRHSRATTDVVDPACIECHKKAFCEDCHRQFKEME